MKKYQTLDEFLDNWKEFITKEDLCKLSRDYWNEALMVGELPVKNDFEFLYHTLNLPGVVIREYFGISSLDRWLNIFGFKKTKEQHQENIRRMNMRKYGVDNPTKIPEIRQKITDTCLKRYGVDNGAKLESSKQKTKETTMRKYGVENAMFSVELKQKLYETNYKKFGCKICTQNEEIKQKMRDHVPEMLKKMEKTNLEKYGVKQVLSLDYVREKGTQTNLKKYGCAHASSSQYVRQKVYETQKRNGTFTYSKKEIYINEQLEQVFGSKDVIHQYRTQIYPFIADFYIISLDLYIEYQGYWKHGKEPFDPNNPKHIEIIESWKGRSQEINKKGLPKTDYLAAIDTWTKTDVKKRTWAKDHNLNWIEFFNMKQFENWLNSYKNRPIS